MTARAMVGIIALVCASTCGLVATFANFEMVDKVNEKLSPDDRFAWGGWYPSKYWRLRDGYKRLYPSGQLLLKVRVLTALMIGCMVVCAWGFGFFA